MAGVSVYFDEMMSRVAAEQLIERGYPVVLAVDVEMAEKPDDEHLVYATENGHVMVTFDRPFAGLASQSTEHGGVICLSGAQNNIGGIVRALTEFAETHTPEDAAGQVFWLK
jgi:predicted nuclease of predicted toxin-antitoxin system